MNYRDQKNLGGAGRGKGAYTAAFLDVFRALSYSRRTSQVWAHFLELSACAVSNAVDPSRYAIREARYLDIAKQYTAAGMQMFSRAHGLMVLELERRGFCDFLGETFMALDLGADSKGQFFTPYEICRMMAGITVSADDVKKTGFITVNEPACGGGAMIIALAQQLAESGLNPSSDMHVVAQDIDPQAVHMAYVQLSYFGISGVVIRCNSLAPKEPEAADVWRTPTHQLLGWDARLAQRRRIDALRRLLSEPAGDSAATTPEVQHESMEFGNNGFMSSGGMQVNLF